MCSFNGCMIHDSDSILTSSQLYSAVKLFFINLFFLTCVCANTVEIKPVQRFNIQGGIRLEFSLF